MKYLLYNADKPVGAFDYENGTINRFDVLRAQLLPMQIRCASADGFTHWLKERAIDLNTFQHRQLANSLFGSRDKTAIAIRNHMFSISDTFTCFREGEFIPRDRLCCRHFQDLCILRFRWYLCLQEYPHQYSWHALFYPFRDILHTDS